MDNGYVFKKGTYRFINFQNYEKFSCSEFQNVGDCEPFARRNTSSGQKVIAPCGAVANSMFNGRRASLSVNCLSKS